MIDRDHKQPISQQAKLRDVSRGTVYYQPKPVSPSDQMLMKRVDRSHLELPFAGARMLRDLLCQEDHKAGRSKVARLMRLMGIKALYRKPKTIRRHAERKVYPYLLRNLVVTRPNQAWAMDITYIPMARRFVHLAAAVDWRSVGYEEVYLHAYDTVSIARPGMGRYIWFYNSRWPHTSLDRQTPDQFYFESPLLPIAA